MNYTNKYKNLSIEELKRLREEKLKEKQNCLDEEKKIDKESDTIHKMYQWQDKKRAKIKKAFFISKVVTAVGILLILATLSPISITSIISSLVYLATIQVLYIIFTKDSRKALKFLPHEVVHKENELLIGELYKNDHNLSKINGDLSDIDKEIQHKKAPKTSSSKNNVILSFHSHIAGARSLLPRVRVRNIREENNARFKY